MALATAGGAITTLPYMKGPAAPSDQVTKQYGLYGSAVGQQAKDYDTLMGNYNDVLTQAKKNIAAPGLTAGTYTPTAYSYNPTAAETSALGNLGELSKTGGYSDTDIANLRERGISPIRSIYANAQRNLDRQRALSGGYSPNYAAATAKMAREQSDLIAGKVTDVNAGIAEQVAKNRLGIAPQYAGEAGRQSEAINKAGQMTTEEQNKANLFNTTNAQDIAKFNIDKNRGSIDDALRALTGMQSLYGTTPALSALFGRQALDTAQFANLQKQQGIQNANNVLGNLARI